MGGQKEKHNLKSKITASRHDNVNFRFLGFKEDLPLRGQVLFRNGEMVLDIPRGGATPYLIDGKPSKHWFEGTNANRAGYNRVDANWALVGGIYVGTWIEEGTKYLFSFEIESVSGQKKT